MDNIVEFPDNDKQYVRLGTEAFENNHLNDAAWYFEQAYKKNNKGHINFLLVSTLLENGQNEEALDFANEQIDFYKNNESYYMTYVSVLISNQLFDQSQNIIDEQLNSTNYPEWEQLNQYLDNEKMRVQEQTEKYKDDLKKKMYSLNVLTVDEQLKTIDEVDIFPLNELQELAPLIFQGPYIHHFTKIGLLQLLIENNDQKIYDFDWFEEKRILQPKQLSLYNAHPTVLKVKKELADHLEKNPSLKEIIDAEVSYHLMLLYPFIDEIVTNTRKWVGLYVNKIQNEEIQLEDVDEESLKLRKWQDYLKQLEHK